MAKKETTVDIAGRQLKLTSLDKVLYPAAGFTKAQVIDYYVRIAPVLLPHLKSRPLTLKRYPDGVNGMFFYEKSCPSYRPDWLKVAPVWSEGRGDYIEFCTIDDVPSLVWAANLADLELHTSLSRAKSTLRPDFLVFDLDPGAPADIVDCCRVGLWVRELFASMGMESFAKTSGSKGLQVYVPLHTAVTYDQTKPFAHAVARLLEDQHPEQVVSDMKKALRVNKVLVDWSQNDDYKTTVCVYSLRAKEQPTVSTPVTWDEVARCLKSKDAKLLAFTYDQTLARVEKYGDLFQPVLELKQKLPAASALPEELAQRLAVFQKKLTRTSSAKGRQAKSGISPTKTAAPTARVRKAR